MSAHASGDVLIGKQHSHAPEVAAADYVTANSSLPTHGTSLSKIPR